jgi:AcrR family transcriptional regulator
MSNPPATLREQTILAAALDVFGRYGFRRASMEDIARAAGLSRPLLYLSFPNKAAIFEAVSRDLCERLLADAHAGWAPELPVQQGLMALVEAVHVPLYRLLKASPHGAELLEAGGGMIGALSSELDRGLRQLVGERLSAQLPGSSHTARLSWTLVASLAGIKAQASTVDELRAAAFDIAHMAQAACA